MAKKEVKTDLWVYELLKDADIELCAQGSDIDEINNALKTASKSGTGNAGYPEYCGVFNFVYRKTKSLFCICSQMETKANGKIKADTPY